MILSTCRSLLQSISTVHFCVYGRLILVYVIIMLLLPLFNIGVVNQKVFTIIVNLWWFISLEFLNTWVLKRKELFSDFAFHVSFKINTCIRRQILIVFFVLFELLKQLILLLVEQNDPISGIAIKFATIECFLDVILRFDLWNILFNLDRS